jgi:transposase-like protein
MKKRDNGNPNNKANGRNSVISPEWRDDERSESSRNGGDITGKNFPTGSPPDPEVKSYRRRFPAAYKVRIVQEAKNCTERGQVGALLRREGLYSSQLTQWKQQFKYGAEQALSDNKRGRKPIQSELEKENEHLKKQVDKLEKRLQQAEMIIDVQKKISDLLGISQPRNPISEDD